MSVYDLIFVFPSIFKELVCRHWNFMKNQGFVIVLVEIEPWFTARCVPTKTKQDWLLISFSSYYILSKLNKFTDAWTFLLIFALVRIMKLKQKSNINRWRMLICHWSCFLSFMYYSWSRWRELGSLWRRKQYLFWSPDILEKIMETEILFDN